MAKEAKKLTMDELQGVAGGTILETWSDAGKLKEWGVKDVTLECASVRKAFAQLGVELKDHGGLENGNEYRINGKLVTHDEALKFVANKLGKEYNP